MTAQWIIPFKGRNKSWSYHINFLWNAEKIYIMDNHRGALPCWLKEINKDLHYRLFHIDAHSDCAKYGNKSLLKLLPDEPNISIPDLLDIKHPGESFPLIRWDNYIEIILDKYPGIFSKIFMATHEDLSTTNFKHESVCHRNLPEFLNELVTDDLNSDGLIINIDFDFFYYKFEQNYKKMFSTDFIRAIFQSIKKGIDLKRIVLVTACFSPECCGSWENAEKICEIFTEELKLDFILGAGI
jgi:hypothetical protein